MTKRRQRRETEKSPEHEAFFEMERTGIEPVTSGLQSGADGHDARQRKTTIALNHAVSGVSPMSEPASLRERVTGVWGMGHTAKLADSPEREEGVPARPHLRPGARPLPALRAGPHPRTGTSPYQQILRSPRWQKVRAAVQARDGERCQLEEQGECYGRLEVHHLVPVREGGDPYDLGNLVVCRGHHEAIEAHYRAERRSRNR